MEHRASRPKRGRERRTPETCSLLQTARFAGDAPAQTASQREPSAPPQRPSLGCSDLPPTSSRSSPSPAVLTACPPRTASLLRSKRAVPTLTEAQGAVPTRTAPTPASSPALAGMAGVLGERNHARMPLAARQTPAKPNYRALRAGLPRHVPRAGQVATRHSRPLRTRGRFLARSPTPHKARLPRHAAETPSRIILHHMPPLACESPDHLLVREWRKLGLLIASGLNGVQLAILARK